jgi:hypothetical protein
MNLCGCRHLAADGLTVREVGGEATLGSDQRRTAPAMKVPGESLVIPNGLGRSAQLPVALAIVSYASRMLSPHGVRALRLRRQALGCVIIRKAAVKRGLTDGAHHAALTNRPGRHAPSDR